MSPPFHLKKIPRRRRRRKTPSITTISLFISLLSLTCSTLSSLTQPQPQPQPQPLLLTNKSTPWWHWLDTLKLSQSPPKLLHPPPLPPTAPPPPSPVSRPINQFTPPQPTSPPSSYASYYHTQQVTNTRQDAASLPKPTQPALALVHQPGHPHALGKRWQGYATVTVFVNTVTVTAGPNPPVQVVTVTLGNEVVGPQGGGTVTVTVGGATQTVGGGPGLVVVGPQSTSTLFVTPTPTTLHTTSTITITAGGSVPTGVASPSSDSGLPPDRPCYPGEENQRYPGTLAPTNPTQTSTLFAIGVFFVFILVSWNLFIIRQIIYPVKLLVVAWHEFGHVVACACSGARLESVTIDPNEGGATRMMVQVYPVAGLPAGYLSSFIFGGVMMFCGFDTLASKVASFIIALSFVVVFWWASGMLTRFLTLGAVGLLIGFWFIDHGGVLRYYVLLVGVMSCWYVLFDIMDDFVFRKMNPCCPVMFEERFPNTKAGWWALGWTVLGALNFVAWILLSLAVWRGTPRGMFCQSQQFLPT